MIHASKLSTFRSFGIDCAGHAGLRQTFHCLLGAYIAASGNWTTIAQHAEPLALYTILLSPGLGLIRSHPRVAFALLAAALGLSFQQPRGFIVMEFFAIGTVLSTELFRRRRNLVPGVRHTSWALVHSCLPFLAGVFAVGHRPGSSALLLCLGFLGVHVGAHSLLGPPEARHPEPVPGTREWTGSAITAAATATMMMIGVAGLMAWIWIYGAGASGIALAAPGALWLLWLGTGWMLGGDEDFDPTPARRHAVGAWLLILLAVGTSVYL